MEFSSLEELEQYLKNDAKISTINPVRFINVETIDVWVQVKAMLNRLSMSHMKISAFCEDDDTAPNLNRLKSRLKKVTTTTLVTPISEYLRINNPIAKKTFEDFLHLEYENQLGKLRVYVPVYRMKEILNDVSLDPRTADSMVFLNTQRENDYSLTIIQKELKVDIEGNTINGFKKYMEYWEENPDKPIILHTKNAVHYQDVVFSDDVRVIISSFDLLRCHYNMTVDFKKDYGTEEQWQFLAQEYRKTKELDSTMSALLSTYKFSVELFRNWKNYNNNKKWLLWLWAKKNVDGGYLFESLKKTSTYLEFIERIYDTIIDFVDDSHWLEYYRERIQLISFLCEIPPLSFWNRLQTISDEKKLACLSNRTDEEKEKIIFAVQSVGKKKAKNYLAYCYPELNSYLSPFEYDESINEYFDEYRWAKVLNSAPEDFIEKVNQIAKEKGERFYKLNSRHSIVNNLYDKDTLILFVDALGAEYVPLLESIFKVKCEIGYCNMPSTTSKNRDFVDGKQFEPKYELDKWKHSNCQFPQNIIQEISIIEELKQIVEEQLVKYKHVLIVADHGSSRMAVLYRNTNVYPIKDGAIKYKYGRYCEDTNHSYEEYECCINKDNYWIFGNYDRFSEHGAPIDEIHGGASLEEMLVPVVKISRAIAVETEETNKKVVSIILEQNEFKMDTDRTVLISFKLSEEIESVEAVVNNERYECKLENGKYSFRQKVGAATEYAAKITCKTILGEIKYKIKKGISSNIDI